MSSICNELQLSRDDVLNMLVGMKINLGNSKLQLSLLQHRLDKALDATLGYCNFPETGSGIDIHLLPKWEDICSFMNTFSQIMTNEMFNLGDPRKEAFPRIVQHICSLAPMLGQEKICYILLNTGKNGVFRNIIVKFLSNLKFNETPMILVQYGVTHTKTMEEYISYTNSMKSRLGAKLVEQYSTSLYEQELFLRLLELNHKRLSQHLQSESSEGLRFSFISPITMLKPSGVTRLSKNTGCVVCGDNTKHLCDCRNVQYCSKECQIKDWKNHKPTCKPLSTGKWHTVALDVALIGINRFGHTDPRTEKIACKSTIVLKLEISPLSGQAQRIIITDQGQTMKMSIRKEFSREGWAAALKAFGRGNTIYRWGRRVRYHEWQICFDRVPEMKPSW